MTTQALFNAPDKSRPRTIQNASDLLPIPSYWQEYPDRDIEYVRWYPPLMGYLDGKEIWKRRHVASPVPAHEKRAAYYLHIPFCNQHCESCPYSKFTTQGRLFDSYLDAIKKEIEIYGSIPYMQEIEFNAGYFGGGTPTSLKSSQLRELITTVNKYLNVSKNCHLTIETTPFEMNELKAETLKEDGFIRVSIGVQSFDEANLGVLGRMHGAKEVKSCVKMLRKVGFREINIDLMYGLAGETMESWKQTIEEFLALEIESVSLYYFILIPFSDLFKKIVAGTAPPVPSLEEAEEMYHYAMERLLTSGFAAVTPKDFIRKSSIKERDTEGKAHFFDIGPDGREGVAVSTVDQLIYPNLVWYQDAEHLPLGPGSVGFINRHYFVNEPNIGAYIMKCNSGKLPAFMGTYVPPDEKQAMSLVMGTKLLKIFRKDFIERHGVDMTVPFGEQIKTLVAQGLVTFDDEALTVTYPKGFSYTDNISKTFFTDKHYRVPQPNVDNTSWLKYIKPEVHREVVYGG